MTFSFVWDTEIKEAAKRCITEPEFIRLSKESSNYELNEEEKSYLEGIFKKYKDPAGMFYISDMIYKVEHALADNRETLAFLYIQQVYDTLDSPTYFKNVFKSDDSSEEWQSRVALRNAILKLFKQNF